MKKKLLAFTMAVFMFGMFSCQKGNETEDPEENRNAEVKQFEFNSAEKQIIDHNNVFAFNLLHKVEAADGNKNVLISPLSASLAIGMLNNGAAGQTQKEIQQALGYENIPIGELNEHYLKTDSLMKVSDNSVAFKTANSIWIDNRLSVLAPFKEVNATYFHAEAKNVDMENSQTAGLINKWCEDKTGGKIKNVLSPPLKGVMYLINALYFKGAWMVAFDKTYTRKEKFYDSKGIPADVQMMQNEVSYRYSQTQDYQAVELPYGNGAFSMVLVLPKEASKLSSIVQSMDIAGWEELLNGLHSQSMTLKLPRFKIEYERELNDDLKALGMKDMFEADKADLSNICNTPLFVSLVKQKANIEVSEEGTEATAVTIVQMELGSAGPSQVKLTFDHPFLYFIKEKSSGIIFFAGTVKNL